MKHKYVILVAGPTAVGKTNLCLKLAQRLRSEIFSFDSRQFYREMNIGTAKPTKQELNLIKHHFINSLSITTRYNVGAFESDFISQLNTYFQDYDIAIATGGSGLYAKAITHGLDTFPAVAKKYKDELSIDLQVKGIDKLAAELVLKDPLYAQEVDLKNPNRVLRALEVIRSSGQPYSSFRKKTEQQRNFKIIKVALNRDRETLYERINKRVDTMVTDGLLEEAFKLRDFEKYPALQTVGYKECFKYFTKEISHEQTIELIKRNTRRYAKRQITWFKNQDRFMWFDASSEEEVEAYVKKRIHFFETN